MNTKNKINPEIFLRAAKLLLTVTYSVGDTAQFKHDFACCAISAASGKSGGKYWCEERMKFISLFNQNPSPSVLSLSSEGMQFTFGDTDNEKNRNARVFALLLCYEMTKSRTGKKPVRRPVAKK